MSTITVTGREIRAQFDTVTIAWLVDGDNYLRCYDVVITPDGWGDDAVVLDWQTCVEHPDCRVLTVAPDSTDTLERVHVGDNQPITITRMKENEQ